MRPLRVLVFVALFVGTACRDARPAAEPERSPLPPVSRYALKDGDCGPRLRVSVFWDFRQGVPAEVRSLVRDGIGEARRYFVFPSKDCESIATSVLVEDKARGPWAARTELGNIYVYTGGRPWNRTTTAGRYHVLFHEWYHLVHEHLTERAWSHPPEWFYEGAAEWMAVQAAAHFGHYPSFEFARDYFRQRALATSRPLRKLTRRIPPGAYPETFMAMDLLQPTRPELVRFWRMLDEGFPWEKTFSRVFDRTPQAFYREFARFRSRGFT